MSASVIPRLDAWHRPPGARPLVLGHRGARHAAPENTRRAFALALDEGADGVELDVRLDAHGRVVVLHDRTLGRVTGGAETRDVETLTPDELARASVDGERVPLLAEVLAWASEKRALVNVELKRDVSRPVELVRAVQRVVRESGAGSECVLFSSFHPGFVAALGALMPRIPRAWLVDRNSLFAKARGFRLFANGVNPQHELVTRANMERWKRAGALVATWTVNDEAEARRVAALGVDAIISDTPGKILRAVG